MLGGMSQHSPDGAATEELIFDAVLTPHRSLSPRGFYLLMAAVALLGFSLGLGFFLIGAWPVVGFMGLEFLLLFLAFRVNYRRGSSFETLALTRDRLEVRRVDHRGRAQSWSFQPYWLRVELLPPQGPDPQLALTSHGRRLIIGRFLAPAERISLAEALQSAVLRTRATV